MWLAWTGVILSVFWLVQGGYIVAKAHLAQSLIASAWQSQLNGQQRVKPWPWADTYPVARLQFKRNEYYVLAGASGRNLAFAPTHISHSALPGERGNMVIAGHRDTHFSSLRELQLDDVITLSGLNGEQRYRIGEIRITHQSQVEWMENTDQSLLTLITCYPFDGTDKNPELRYVVRAEKIEQG